MTPPPPPLPPPPPPPHIHETLKQLLKGATLSSEESRELFAGVLAGALDSAQIASMLSLIAVRGATVDELVGGAQAMRNCVTRVPVGPGAPVIDTCGTGGAPKTFNVSTIGAIVAAASAPGRVRVAKHGSLSRSGRGSAEVMRALGVNIEAGPEVQARCLEALGVCFSFAVQHHPAMKHAAGVRKSLGFPTIFNLLGPLTNPAGATRQIIGTYERSAAEKLAAALKMLGAERAMVVTAIDGLDEISVTAPTLVYLVENGRVSESVFDAASVGMARASVESLRVESLEAAAGTFRSVLANTPGPKLDMVVLNAGAALFVAGVASSIAQGVELAREGIASGNAQRTLGGLIELSRGST